MSTGGFDPAKVQARERAREVVTLVFAVMQEEAEKLAAGDQRQTYWEELRSLVLEQAPLPTQAAVLIKATPMTDEEARRFNRELIPFGQYANRQVSDVRLMSDGLRYLRWLADQTFQDELRRYLENRSVRDAG